MPKEYYDRYQRFKVDGKFKPLPFIELKPKSTDKTVVWNSDRSRCDKLSQEYYDNPYHGWLIMLANPQYGGVEDTIPDKEIIRIPFPFRESLQQYIDAVEEYQTLYGDQR
jgi:hypothetical protein